MSILTRVNCLEALILRENKNMITTLLLILAFTSRVYSADKITVAVTDFTAQNASATDASILSGLIRVALANSGQVLVVEKRNMDKILSEQAFQQTGCTSQDCAVKLGKILNVKKIIVGTYSLLGQSRYLTASLVDVETGGVERSATQKGFTNENADEATKQLVDKLLGVEDSTGSETTPSTTASPVEEHVEPAVASSGATETPPTLSTGISAGMKPAKSSAKTMSVVTIKTAKGTIKFTLLPQYAPVHVEKFIALTKKKFYDGLTFHRVVPGFVIQGGDPAGNGSGGPGYTIKAEFSARKHLLGTVAMARTPDPDSAGSQFYICLGALPSLDNQYTVFGQVFEGQDVVNSIAVGDKMISVKVSEVATSKIPEAARN